MKKRLTVSDTSAPEQGKFNASSRFLGTHNKRHLRVLAVLLMLSVIPSCAPTLPEVLA